MPVRRLYIPPLGTLVIATVLLIPLTMLVVPVAADLPRIYQSDDVDRVSGNITTDDANEIARYVDFVFPAIPRAIEEQNRRFLESFPLTDDWSSAMPAGVRTKSGDVIKDAYVLLVPVKGFVRLFDGRYLADNEVVVGYVCDYRVQLPPDRTGDYPKHYYYLQSSEVRVTVNSADVKESRSKRDILSLTVGGDITAVAEITVVVKEVVKDLHTSCSTTCDEEGNCNTSCHTYVVTYEKYHRYALTVSDRINVKKPSTGVVYTLIDDGRPREHWIFPQPEAAYVADDGGNAIVTGLMYYTSYRMIKECELHKTAGKAGEPATKRASLKEPCYVIAALPSCGIAVLKESSFILQTDAENASVKGVPNFAYNDNLSHVEALRLKFSGNVTLRDPFGNELPCRREYRLIVTPSVDIDVKCGETTCRVLMRVSSDGYLYSGPVFLSCGAKSLTLNVTGGNAEFSVERGYIVDYRIPTNLPDRWYRFGGPYVNERFGSFETGTPSYVLPWYEFLVLLAAAVPFIVLFFILRREGEDEEYF